eukprot:TRINITY_DN5536_c1_g1_i1.p1 TRINITY_DN5536_c1_g1~~TRINITY_DN5536_c1_g1_i1.p1  ORF type:complete len:433 (+),score=108.17 TRINITY_DN5536_c1_g1_i1:52-1350(+)
MMFDKNRTLLIRTREHGCGGLYKMILGRRQNGYPVWCCRGERWLYSTRDPEAAWHITDEESDLETGKALLCCTESHFGCPPDSCGTWQSADGNGSWNTLHGLDTFSIVSIDVSDGPTCQAARFPPAEKDRLIRFRGVSPPRTPSQTEPNNINANNNNFNRNGIQYRDNNLTFLEEQLSVLSELAQSPDASRKQMTKTLSPTRNVHPIQQHHHHQSHHIPPPSSTHFIEYPNTRRSFNDTDEILKLTSELVELQMENMNLVREREIQNTEYERLSKQHTQLYFRFEEIQQMLQQQHKQQQQQLQHQEHQQEQEQEQQQQQQQQQKLEEQEGHKSDVSEGNELKPTTTESEQKKDVLPAVESRESPPAFHRSLASIFSFVVGCLVTMLVFSPDSDSTLEYPHQQRQHQQHPQCPNYATYPEPQTEAVRLMLEYK